MVSVKLLTNSFAGYDFGIDITLVDSEGKKLPDTIVKKQGEDIVILYNATGKSGLSIS